MADFGGFEVKTPQEVLAEIAAQQQQIAAMRDPRAQRNANIQFQLANAFGNPELKKAKALERTMTDVDATMKKSGEQPGTLAWEQKRLEGMYNAVKDRDPAAASQIASRLTEIDEQRFERKRLEAQDKRAEQDAFDRHRESTARAEKAERLNNMNNISYVASVDEETGEMKIQAYNPNDPESRLAFEKAKMVEGNVVLSREEAADKFDQGLLDDADMTLHNNSAFTTRLGTYEAQRNAFERATRIGSVLAGNPNANTGTAGLINSMNEAGQEALAVHSKVLDVLGVPLNENYNSGAIETALKGFKWYTELDGSDQAAMKGLTLNMAYVLARSLDPSGRLSDADVMFAARMIGASQGDPKVLMRVMTDQIWGASEKVLRADRTDLGSLTERERRTSSQARRLGAQMEGLSNEREAYKQFLIDSGLISQEEVDLITTRGAIRDQRTRRSDNRPGGPRSIQEEEAVPVETDDTYNPDTDFEGLSLNNG